MISHSTNSAPAINSSVQNSVPPEWLARAMRRLTVLTFVCPVLLLTLYLLAVRTDWGQRAGNAALAGRSGQPPGLIQGSMGLLETISIASLGMVAIALFLVGLLRGGWPLGIAIGLMIFGANVSTQVLKRVIFSRPLFTGQGEEVGIGNSLPSGHVTVALTVGVALMIVATPRVRPWLAAIGGGYAALVGAATVSAGWHRPSDVIAAALVAVGWAALTSLVLIVLRERTPRRSATSAGTARWHEEQLRTVMLISGIVLAGALLTLTAVVMQTSWEEMQRDAFDGAFVAGVLAGIASVALMLGALGYALSRVDLAAMTDSTQE